MDLYQDIFLQSKLYTNANNLNVLQNYIVGNINLGSYAFGTTVLVSTSNFNININSASSNTFTSLAITFPQEFNIATSACSVPSSITCTLEIASNTLRLVSATTISLPFSFSVNNIITPSFSPSTTIYLQTFSNTNFAIDQNNNIIFQTSCTLPCRTCPTLEPNTCNDCYTNTTLVSNRIYLNGTRCVSFCENGYFVNNVTNICDKCTSTCFTCSNFTYCLSCTGVLLFYDNSCLVACPSGYYGFNSKCILCPTVLFCSTCLDNLQCSSCKSGYYLYNFQCSTTCPYLISYYNDPNRTCDNCP